jgi:hypothetical protein
MKRLVKTFEEFIGDKHDDHVMKKNLKYTHGKEVFSINTNEPGKEYDQEDDGSDQINRSTIQRYSAAER